MFFGATVEEEISQEKEHLRKNEPSAQSHTTLQPHSIIDILYTL